MHAHRLTRREFLSAAGALPARRPRCRGSATRRRARSPSPTASRPSSTRSTSSRGRSASSRRRGSRRTRASSCRAGAPRWCRPLAAGQAMFALGDSNHPLKISEKGKEAVILFATDTRCSYANIVARKELYDAGLTSIDKLATMKRPGGGKWVIAATAIGSGTWVYGSHILEQQTDAGRASPLNDLVEWVGGGASTTMLGRAQGREVRRDHGGAGMDVGGRGPGVRQGDLQHPGRAGVEPRLRRAAAGHRRASASGRRSRGARPPSRAT